MPDPRGVVYSGEIMWGNKDGTSGAMDAYGRMPWEPDYNKETDSRSEFKSFHRFQGEFARLFGPYRRGRSFQLMTLDPERDTDKFHQYHLSLEKRKKKSYK